MKKVSDAQRAGELLGRLCNIKGADLKTILEWWCWSLDIEQLFLYH